MKAKILRLLILILGVLFVNPAFSKTTYSTEIHFESDFAGEIPEKLLKDFSELNNAGGKGRIIQALIYKEADGSRKLNVATSYIVIDSLPSKPILDSSILFLRNIQILKKLKEISSSGIPILITSPDQVNFNAQVVLSGVLYDQLWKKVFLRQNKFPILVITSIMNLDQMIHEVRHLDQTTDLNNQIFKIQKTIKQNIRPEDSFKIISVLMEIDAYDFQKSFINNLLKENPKTQYSWYSVIKGPQFREYNYHENAIQHYPQISIDMSVDLYSYSGKRALQEILDSSPIVYCQLVKVIRDGIKLENYDLNALLDLNVNNNLCKNF